MDTFFSNHELEDLLKKAVLLLDYSAICFYKFEKAKFIPIIEVFDSEIVHNDVLDFLKEIVILPSKQTFKIQSLTNTYLSLSGYKFPNTELIIIYAFDSSKFRFLTDELTFQNIFGFFLSSHYSLILFEKYDKLSMHMKKMFEQSNLSCLCYYSLGNIQSTAGLFRNLNLVEMKQLIQHFSQQGQTRDNHRYVRTEKSKIFSLIFSTFSDLTIQKYSSLAFIQNATPFFDRDEQLHKQFPYVKPICSFLNLEKSRKEYHKPSFVV
jgi:hypothetical protein